MSGIENSIIIQNEKWQEDISVGFLDILLDETLITGTVYIPADFLGKVSTFNARLPDKQYYEFLLRLAMGFPVCLSGKAPEQAESYLVLDSPAACIRVEGLQTDCYLASRYKKILLEKNVFDAVVESILAQARQMGCLEQIASFLEEMLQEGELYRYYFQGSQPFLIYTGAGICYHVLDVFAQSLGAALRKKGYLVEYFDLSKEDHTEAFRYIGKSFQAVIGMQSYMFSARLTDGGLLHDKIYGPKYNFVFDHPICFRRHLEEIPKDLAILTLDRNYADFIRRYYQGKAYFLPPGGLPKPLSGHGRIYDVVFIGSYVRNAEELSVHLKHCSRRKRFLINRFLLNMRRRPELPAEDALRLALKPDHEMLTDAEFFELFHELRIYMMYMSYHFRYKVMEALVGSGIKVDVFGSSWEFCPLRAYPDFIWHKKDLSMDECLDIWQRSKIALNMMSCHKDAVTERILNSMLQKAAVCTERNPYLEEQFRDGQDIIFYEIAHLERLPGMVASYLGSPDKLAEIGEEGFQKARQFHTWESRAEEFLGIISGYKEKIFE